MGKLVRYIRLIILVIAVLLIVMGIAGIASGKTMPVVLQDENAQTIEPPPQPTDPPPPPLLTCHRRHRRMYHHLRRRMCHRHLFPPTPVPPTNTPVPPTPVPPTNTPVPPTPVPPTNTPVPTNTLVPATSTPRPTNTPVPTNTPLPTNTATRIPTITPLPQVNTGGGSNTSSQSNSQSNIQPTSTNTPFYTVTPIPTLAPELLGQTVAWIPVTACERKCVRWELYQTNRTGDWEIFRLGETEAEVNVSDGLGDGIDDIAPSRSPNGEWVAFSSNRDGNWEIYVARSDGSDLQRITSNVTATDINPVWGPNNFVVYQSNRDGDWNLYIVDVATGVQQRLTTTSDDELNPTWSPDGAHVAYQTNKDGRWQIHAISPQTGENRLLSNGDRNDFDPVYSPDGSRIAFRSVLDGKDKSLLFIMGAQGGRVSPVSNPIANAYHPAWSADSQLLAYQSDLDGDQDIYIFDTSSLSTRQLTNNNVDDYAPNFRCDTNTVLFNSDISGNPDIYEADALPLNAGAIDVATQARTLTSDIAADLYPADGMFLQSPNVVTLLPNSSQQLATPLPTVGNYPLIRIERGQIEPIYPRLVAWSPVNACENECPSWSLYTRNDGGFWSIVRRDNDETGTTFTISNPFPHPADIPADNIMPSHSPNGQWVAFASNRDKNWEIYIGALDGSRPLQRVTYSKGMESNPVWSPGGQYIVYQSLRDGDWELYLFDISSGRELRLTNNPASDTNPNWSPDGSKLVFQSNRSGVLQVYLIDLSNGVVSPLTDDKFNDFSPQFSPDGQYIVYTSAQGNNGNRMIYGMQADGSNPAPISDPAQDATNPAWADQGTLIAYQVHENGRNTIYIYDALTGTRQQLTSNNVNAFAPEWSCGGDTTLIFNSDFKGNANIYAASVLPMTGAPIQLNSQATQLTDDAGADLYAPDVAPSGNEWTLTDRPN
ncbi:MAG: hypothetical protein R3E39_30945 [Anaerolineae bacterium]